MEQQVNKLNHTVMLLTSPTWWTLSVVCGVVALSPLPFCYGIQTKWDRNQNYRLLAGEFIFSVVMYICTQRVSGILAVCNSKCVLRYWLRVWTINEPNLPYETGLDVTQSHPLCRTRFGQCQASSAALGWPGTAISCTECSQVAGLIGRNFSKAPSLCAAVFCSKIA